PPSESAREPEPTTTCREAGGRDGIVARGTVAGNGLARRATLVDAAEQWTIARAARLRSRLPLGGRLQTVDQNPTLSLLKLFGLPSRFEIPIFQRPYAWKQTDHWEPLWTDVRQLADRSLAGAVPRSHFLGALVLDAVRRPPGTLETRWVIDGQQRLTTVQLLL